MNPWYMTSELVESPQPTHGQDDRLDSFFQLVPPTPHHPQVSQSLTTTASPFTALNTPFTADTTFPYTPDLKADDFQLQNHHLNPNQLTSHNSSYNLRGHRSHLSIGSVDSHISSSAFSNLSGTSGQWSNVSSGDSVSVSGSEFDGQSQLEHGHTHAHGQGQIAGKRKEVALSIDPKLFQPKEKRSLSQLNVVESAALTRATPGEPEAEPATAKPAAKRSKSNTKGSGGAVAAQGAGKKGKSTTGSSVSGGKKKVSHARKQQADHIPRPRNAFILFRKHVVDSKLIPASVEMRHQNVSIITAKMWSEAPAEQKAHFNALAKKEKEDHMKKYPGYRYQPVYRRTNVIRRRVRKDEAEEEKCRSVAELLLKGKSGSALESEIREKIRRGEHGLPPKKIKAPAQRDVGDASELSKGAIRALRAEARQQTDSVGSSPAPSEGEDHGDGDWADYDQAALLDSDSRAVSLNPELGQGEGFPAVLGSDFTAEGNGTGTGTGTGPRGSGIESWGSGVQDSMAYVHPALGKGWDFHQQHPGPEESTQMSMSVFEGWSSSEIPSQDFSGIQTYAYPQPQTQSQTSIHLQPQAQLPSQVQASHTMDYQALDTTSMMGMGLGLGMGMNFVPANFQHPPLERSSPISQFSSDLTQQQRHQQHHLSSPLPPQQSRPYTDPYGGINRAESSPRGKPTTGPGSGDMLTAVIPSPTSVPYPGLLSLPAGQGRTDRKDESNLSDPGHQHPFNFSPSHDVAFGSFSSMGLDMADMGMNMGMDMGMGMDMNFGHDDGELLHDFGAALAQADEMAHEWQ